MSVELIDEAALPEFRERFLAPSVMYDQIPDRNAALLISAPPGVGKTVCAHGLVAHALSKNHDLVIYVAPTRALIDELHHYLDTARVDGWIVTLNPRPKNRCGVQNGEWQELETTGCAAFAKDSLCRNCQHYLTHHDSCRWPDQMESIEENTRVVVFTEAYLVLNPLILQRIIALAETENPLVILDEATFLTGMQTRSISVEHLQMFARALRSVRGPADGSGDGLGAWIDAIGALLDGCGDLDEWPTFSRFDLLDNVLAIQTAGRKMFGNDFLYIAHDLSLQRMGWYHSGAFTFPAQLNTRGMDVVIFSPYLPIDVIEEHLGRLMVGGLPTVTFRHSKTMIANIRESVSAMKSLKAQEHFNRVVVFFVALLLQDHLHGRRSVIVAKKKLLPKIYDRVVSTSRELGRPIVPACLGEDEISGETTVVMMNYGVVGVNSLTDFDTLYCIGGYYARENHVSSVYQQALPPWMEHAFKIRTIDHQRQVVPADGGFITRAHAERAQFTLEMLERRVVLQAVGRIRPFTTPADIVLFRMDDLSEKLGDVETHDTLATARQAWGYLPARSLRAPRLRMP